MSLEPILHKLAMLAGAAMVVGGLALGAWTLSRLPSLSTPAGDTAVAAAIPASPLSAAPVSPLSAAEAPSATLETPLETGTEMTIGLAGGLPASLAAAANDLRLTHAGVTAVPAASPDATVILNWDETGGEAAYRQFFAAATRFDTIDLSLRMRNIQQAWTGGGRAFRSVAIIEDTLPALQQILGEPGSTVTTYATPGELIDGVWGDTRVLALIPFDLLSPRLAVYTVDGQTPVENAAKFNPTAYPLVATVYAHPGPAATGQSVAAALDLLPRANRDSSRLTVVAMTGVTAMVRLTAEQMDRQGYDWPAQIVGPELAAADITAISNEVPFVPGCETNTDRDNLVFCSKPDYMATLEASGADIIGLTGNHQNDYGLEDALTSLTIYAEAGLPVYGGGEDRDSAFAPLYVEHNGNRLAFLGANSYGPPSAWATDSSPGSAPFDLAIMSATIRAIKEQHDADVVLAELQYQESYDVQPLVDQQLDFSALVRAGADIVTGVQSHVPQGLEFLDDKLILYGLGNLYFDQMWDEATREGLIVKHTIYAGRHISTQLMPTLLQDYGQPHWADPERRAAILAKVFGASAWQ
ncbi:MAG: CapA family protein [Caldilineaceae bacterium]|nr:CapA family protein [Caldilineaceae bacterium]